MSCSGFTMNEITDKVDRIVAENKEIWKSKAMFFSFIKGLLRRGWMRHPVKIKLINKYRKQIPNPKPKGRKMVWGAECSICHETHVLSNIEIDHKLEESAILTKLSDIQSCAEKLLVVVEDDLRILCKPCHSIVSLAASHNLTFDEAVIEKKIIALMKDRKKCLVILEEHGYDTKTLKNEAKRREALRQIFKGEQI